MQRSSLYSFCFLLATLLILVAGCAKPRDVIEWPKPVEGLTQVETPTQVVVAQATKVDLNALTRETQKTSEKVDKMTLVWWITEEYWEAGFAQDPDITAAEAEKLYRILRPYTIIAVVDGKVGTFGGVTYKSESEVRASIQIRDSKGTGYPPLSEGNIDADTRSFLINDETDVRQLTRAPRAEHASLCLPSQEQNWPEGCCSQERGSFLGQVGQKGVQMAVTPGLASSTQDMSSRRREDERCMEILPLARSQTG